MGAFERGGRMLTVAWSSNDTHLAAGSDSVGYRYRARFELTKGGSAPSNRVAAFRGVVRFQVPGAIFVVTADTGHLPRVEILATYFWELKSGAATLWRGPHRRMPLY